ncbi:trehalose-phosphatase [Chelativorans sp. M5D2P16]|uniref:trehalose-phosphatase n=1 Tax=Chelativorans sp. M5D2P16 TaxID=3095678 RepID=UPI002ACAEC4A|nr:trehalose-phosphatase [Chelativorans sp. M5D2P16]MDZ5696322.1 trehalose-phosphatase [Chelativorans sp. M5D2P16]
MADRPEPLQSFDHSGLTPGSTAIFLDFDGTLADIVEHPDAVSVPLPTREVLARLERSTQGALAIVTGRPIQEIDRFLAPLSLPVAGVHGLERRGAGGQMSAKSVDAATFTTLGDKLGAFTAAHPGTMVETKSGSLALHYRQRPDLGLACAAAVHEAVDGLQGLHILHGKMVIEVKSGQATKADAVAAFMDEAPFKGRVPLFAGDDVTDEDAFREVARASGISIKIGAGDTAAVYRSEDTDAFRMWLSRLADSFETHSLSA